MWERFMEDMQAAGFEVNAVKTNADHIRSMTDEELAKFIADKIPHGDCYGCPWFYSCFCDSESCGDNFLDWLKQPYKEDT